MSKFPAEKRALCFRALVFLLIVLGSIAFSPITGARAEGVNPLDSIDSLGLNHYASEQKRNDSIRVKVDSLIVACMRTSDYDSVKTLLQVADFRMRREILSRPAIWRELNSDCSTTVIFTILLSMVLLMAILGSRGTKWLELVNRINRNKNPASPNVDKTNYPGGTGLHELLALDTAPVAFDIFGHGPLLHHSYRGIIHFLRDVTEKVLSFALLLFFLYLVAKVGAYFTHYVSGDGWRLVFVPIDINIGLAFVGWALILDGFIQVSAMVDAPGVSRTLDSIIVIVAGYVVMLVEAFPGERTLVSFSVGSPSWLGPVLAVVIGLLFIVRKSVAAGRDK